LMNTRRLFLGSFFLFLIVLPIVNVYVVFPDSIVMNTDGDDAKLGSMASSRLACAGE